MSEPAAEAHAPVSGQPADDLSHFLDIPVRVSIQLGTRGMKVRDILRLQPSSIVDLPKSAGDSVDILVNGRIIAFGEVLELENCTGIRLTEFNTVA